MVDADASTRRARTESAPPDVVLQMVSSLALTMLGEVLGSSLTGKLLAGALGALLGTFLTARGSHHTRRIVAVALLLALLDVLRGAASALASTAPRGTGGDSRGHVGPADWVPRQPLLTLAVGLAGFALGTGATAIAHGLNSSPRRLVNTTTISHVPDVIGRDASQAETILAANGFHAAIHRQRSLHGGDGRIQGQSPSPGESEPRGSTVVLTVAAGSSSTSSSSGGPSGRGLSALVPNVVGLAVEEAKARLSTARLSAVLVRESSEKVPVDLVIASTPAAGAAVKEGSTVTLTVSDGPPIPEPVGVPALTGLAVKTAEAKLSETDLTPGRGAVNESSETVPSGSVIRSNPPAGTSVAKGSTVTLTVSTGLPRIE